MENNIVDIKSISDLHRVYDYGKPKHPLVTIIDFAKNQPSENRSARHYRTHLYIILCKQAKGDMKYGAGHYDFEEGSLLFMSPNQVFKNETEIKVAEGWGVFVHPDLLYGSYLGEKIHDYSYFNYDVNEALHVSVEEKMILQDCRDKIIKEYEQNIDQHTQTLIIDNLHLLLNYCKRFYDRQFHTRAKINSDVVQKFERYLQDYFNQNQLIETGLPSVKHFAEALHLSPDYLSDLLKKSTGKTTMEHIHLQIVDKAKGVLLATEKPISSIAFDLGFEHPSHFTKLFKSKTNLSPKEYRQNYR